MFFAVIADVHGNLPALRAVMADAMARGAEGFLFAGDYCVSAPWADGVVDVMRGLPQAVCVRGNEERYLHLPDGDDAQFAVSRWTARSMKKENIAWLDALPEEVLLLRDGVEIRMAHSSEAFIGDAELRDFKTRKLIWRYPHTVSQAERLADMRAVMESDTGFMARVAELERGVYVFGHTHSQWHLQFGDVLLLNPGSCGLAVDCGEPGAPYTLLRVENGTWRVEERRVKYDIEATIADVKRSGQYAAAPEWSEMIFAEWRTGREMALYMLRYIDAYARRIGDDRRPFMADTWAAGFAAWRAEPSPWVMVEAGDFPK